MVRVSYLRHFETSHFDAFLIENKVEFFAWRAARVSCNAVKIGRLEPCSSHKQVNLVFAPKGIEIAGNNNRLFRALDQVVQVPQLQVPMAIFH